jgi:RimJ/RimL family protein N-acetyltransferase
MAMPSLHEPVVDPKRLTGPQPEISDQGLILRRWTVRDCPGLVAAFRDDAIRKWNLRSLDTPAEALALITSWKQGWKRHVSASWAVVAEAEPVRVLGQVGFRSLYPHDGMAEVSYWVLPGHRRQGIATHAADVLARWALDDLGLVRLELVHSVHNHESCGVAKAAGFDHEGVKRRLQRHVDGWHDMCLHSRIAADSPTPPSRPIPLRLRVAARLERSSWAADAAAGRARELTGSRR